MSNQRIFQLRIFCRFDAENKLTHIRRVDDDFLRRMVGDYDNGLAVSEIENMANHVIMECMRQGIPLVLPALDDKGWVFMNMRNCTYMSCAIELIEP